MPSLKYNRWLMCLCFLIVTIGLFCLSSPAKAAPLSLSLVSHATGLSAPVDIAYTGLAGDDRLFVAERSGLIKIVQGNGTVSGTFLNIDTRVLGNGEQGLLGLAFHPNYASNGFFYVYYVDNSGGIVISRFSRDASNPDLADLNSEQIILTIPHPGQTNHYGGDLNFNPGDGYLYIATGDGGSGNDPPNNSQNLNVLLGKILRLDINADDFPADAARNYAIPSNNPFVSVVGNDEIWSYGLRNPWRFSFDKSNNDMIIADVGQSAREEVNVQAAGNTGGQNYGWRCREGTIANPSNPSGCTGFSGYIDPVTEYTHTNGACSITGGYIYRGSQYPSMSGNYLFADYCNGQFYSLGPNGSGGWDQSLQTQFNGRNISSFGQDNEGELYVSDVTNGTIYKVQSQPSNPIDVPVYRLNRGGNYLYTSSATEMTDAVSRYGYAYENTAFYASNGASSGLSPVYRLTRGGNYLFTTSTAERDNAVTNLGFALEGIAFYASNNTSTGLSAIYRLRRDNNYLFTTSSVERDNAVANYGYTTEGTAFYAPTMPSTNLAPIFRLNRHEKYLYTQSAAEFANAVKGYSYMSEGIAFYASTSSSVGLTPVYRLTKDNGYLFTSSTAERDSAVTDYGYKLEGIAFYASNNTGQGLTQVYRLNRNGNYLFTISSTERDDAVAYGYAPEGISFYTYSSY